jgi:hypothetical protein
MFLKCNGKKTQFIPGQALILPKFFFPAVMWVLFEALVQYVIGPVGHFLSSALCPRCVRPANG